MNFRLGKAQVFASVGVVLVLVALIAGAFAFGIYPFSVGDSTSGRIAFVSGRDGDGEIYVMNADGSGVVQLTDNDSGDGSPAWSPDGKRIAFASDRGNDVYIDDIYVMNADGSGVEQLTDGCNNGQLEWSPDGGRIAFTSRGNIHVMNADGSGLVQLTGTSAESCAGLFFSDRDGDGYRDIYLRNADGSIEPFTEYDYLDLAIGDVVVAWLSDGDRMVFISDRDGDLGVYVMNADGSDVERLTEYDNTGLLFPAWSPSGGLIAFSSFSGENLDDVEIHVMNSDGGGVERLTENEYGDWFPSWSPDGGRISFVSDRDGDTSVYVMKADGSGVKWLADGHSPAWSPLLD